MSDNRQRRSTIISLKNNILPLYWRNSWHRYYQSKLSDTAWLAKQNEQHSRKSPSDGLRRFRIFRTHLSNFISHNGENISAVITSLMATLLCPDDSCSNPKWSLLSHDSTPFSFHCLDVAFLLSYSKSWCYLGFPGLIFDEPSNIGYSNNVFFFINNVYS